MKKLIATILFALAFSFAFAQKYTDADLVWQDNFDGDELDLDKWDYDPHTPGWVNEELQSYETSDENIYVKDGCLVIQVTKIGYLYKSARITTYDKFSFKYGRIEARLKVPKGKAFGPHIGLQPVKNSYGPWPRSGYIDAININGKDVKTVSGGLIFGEPTTYRYEKNTLTDGDFSKDFHVFAVEWEPSEIRFYVDGTEYNKTSDWWTKPAEGKKKPYPAPFNQDFHIILNLAVGGKYLGAPDSTTKLGENARLLVDYIRVYQKKSYDENVTAPTFEEKTRAPDADGNILLNPRFEQGGKNWELYTAEGGDGSASFKDGAAAIKIKNPGNVSWGVQLVQKGCPIEKNCEYELSFDASAAENRTIKLYIHDPDLDYKTVFYSEPIKVGPEQKHYVYSFSTNYTMQDSKPNCQISFQFSKGNKNPTADIVLKNVLLKKKAK